MGKHGGIPSTWNNDADSRPACTRGARDMLRAGTAGAYCTGWCDAAGQAERVALANADASAGGVHFAPRHPALGCAVRRLPPAAAKLDPRLPTPDDLLVYMGAGCFWHVQHELIVAENKILGRDANTYTAVAGYAGGTKVGSDSKVCYHNMMGDSDYGKMGHTEVVAVKIPNDRLLFFMEAFLNLFDARGIRADPQDAGGEYRTALGLPGGIDNPAVKVLKEFASEKGMKVLAGKGNEPDTLKDRVIYVYDTEAFPFYPGELYHQYHNDMMADYGKECRAMRSVAEERGALTVSKCPGDAKFFTSTKAGASMNPSAGANSVSAAPDSKPKIAFD